MYLSASGILLRVWLYLSFVTLLSLQAITLGSPLQTQDILKGSQVHISDESNRSVKEVLSDPSLFSSYEQEKVELGYTDQEIWTMFILENNSSDTSHPIIEIDNPILDYVHLYEIEDGRVVDHHLQGALLPLGPHGQLNFHFDLTVEANMTKQYLLHASSKSSALYFHATLMSHHDFIDKELLHQLALTLFFGLIIGLIIYNFFIYFFTKEVTYLYYIGYQLFTILAYASYTKIINHLLRPMMLQSDAYLGVFYLMGSVLFMLLFTRAFLHAERFPWIDLGMKVIALLAIINLAVSYSCCYLMDASSMLIMFTSGYLIISSLYLMSQKVPHALYFVVGWSTALTGLLMLGLHQVGLTPFPDSLLYLYPAGVAFEAILFSIMLARRINHVKALATALATQKVLTRELHHRVKNNMQLIISLYRLKFADVKNKAIKERLKESENNIIAMSTIHQILFEQKELEKLDTQTYFQRLLDAMRSSFAEKQISTTLNCSVSLTPDQAIHCGIILNEVVTNSIKHAFDEGVAGEITIALYEKESHIIFEMADNGKGYDKSTIDEGFGLMMLQALVRDNLHGTVEVVDQKGTAYRITWKQ